MATHTQRGTIETTFHSHQTELRVSFRCPAGGYTLDDLDALRVAVDYARRKIHEEQRKQLQIVLPPLVDDAAFNEQQSRMAAPS